MRMCAWRRAQSSTRRTVAPFTGRADPGASTCTISARVSPFSVSITGTDVPSSKVAMPVSPGWPPPCG